MHRILLLALAAATASPAVEGQPQQGSKPPLHFMSKRLSVEPHIERFVTVEAGAGCKVLGTIWDDKANDSAPAASVALLQLGGHGRVRDTRTDDQGRYRVTIPAGTSWRVLARRAGASAWEDSPKISCPTASLRMNPATKERHWFWGKEPSQT